MNNRTDHSYQLYGKSMLTALWINSMWNLPKDKSDIKVNKIYTRLEWADEFRILGFNIDNKLERLHTNIEICTRKVRAIINIWRKYNLTINGRMTVAKALLLSQYTYVATVLDLSQKESEYIQSILDNFILYNSFLNHGHKSRYWINQDILYGNRNLGGFNAIRFSDFLLSLKTSWTFGF